MLERQKSNQERIKYLVEEVKRHRYLYYNEQPEISDAKYSKSNEDIYNFSKLANWANDTYDRYIYLKRS